MCTHTYIYILKNVYIYIVKKWHIWIYIYIYIYRYFVFSYTWANIYIYIYQKDVYNIEIVCIYTQYTDHRYHRSSRPQILHRETLCRSPLWRDLVEGLFLKDPPYMDLSWTPCLLFCSNSSLLGASDMLGPLSFHSGIGCRFVSLGKAFGLALWIYCLRLLVCKSHSFWEHLQSVPPSGAGWNFAPCGQPPALYAGPTPLVLFSAPFICGNWVR